MSAHTPTPWYVQPFNGDDVHNLLISSKATKKSPGYLPVATMTGCHIDTPANAAFIVRACNAHDELLALAKQYASECGECDGRGILTGEIGFEAECPDCYDIRAVIAKAQS